MTEEFFIETHCPLCGTQSCYGQIEDLSHCGAWKKLHKYPNDEYKMRLERIDRRTAWRKKHWKWFVKRTLSL